MLPGMKINFVLFLFLFCFSSHSQITNPNFQIQIIGYDNFLFIGVAGDEEIKEITILFGPNKYKIKANNDFVFQEIELDNFVAAPMFVDLIIKTNNEKYLYSKLEVFVLTGDSDL